NDAQLAKKIIFLRKLLARGKMYVARSYRKSRGVCNAHFVPNWLLISFLPILDSLFFSRRMV
ncbi:MAG TPA: hypothetical protein DIT54_06815, partial [Lachnospiraceae bacterium]|nr:hypothetical protein [Lachnospiraceae bacterium]